MKSIVMPEAGLTVAFSDTVMMGVIEVTAVPSGTVATMVLALSVITACTDGETNANDKIFFSLLSFFWQPVSDAAITSMATKNLLSFFMLIIIW